MHYSNDSIWRKKSEKMIWFSSDDKVTKVEAETAARIKAGRKLRLARCHHASRRCGGSMGGTASAVPRLKSKRQLPERQCHFGTSQDCLDSGTTGQTDEEPLQHHEAVQPHKTWFHDQYSCQQTCRWVCHILLLSSNFFQIRKTLTN